jgi:prepilin-type N-terminal cleavage/methylation domain-containing protein
MEHGFTMVECLVSSAIFLLVAAGVFGVLTQVQRTVSYQVEIQGVLESTRLAMDTVERILQQAGNDPHGVGFAGITITNSTEVRVRSDLTGSAGPGSPDKGDPDGDTDDAYEDITIRFDAAGQSIDLVYGAGAAQPIASNISAFAMQYFDRNGIATSTGKNVSRIRLSITGVSSFPDPQTGRAFSMELISDVCLAAR